MRDFIVVDDLPLILIPLLLCAAGLIAVLFAWYFIFGRSTKRVLLAIVAAVLNREDTVDPDAPIPIPERENRVSDIMNDMADESGLHFEAQIAGERSTQPPRADVPPIAQNNRVDFPVADSPALRRTRRPFRRLRLNNNPINHSPAHYPGEDK